MSNDISRIDKNLSIETTLVKDGVAFYDVRRAPFSVYGLYDYKNQPDFKQENIKFVSYGRSIVPVMEEAGLNIEISAPTVEAPSVAKALELYLSKN